MRSKRCSMQNNFVPEKMKRAKWILTKNLERAREKEEALNPKVHDRKAVWWRRWWRYLKPGFLRLWW